MLDLKPVEKQAVWHVLLQVDRILWEMKNEIQALQERVKELEANKADRKGPKKTK